MPLAVTAKAPIPSDSRENRRTSERRVAASLNYSGPKRRINALDRRAANVHDVARSFGVSPEHLEAVSHDEAMEGVARCPNCESLSRKCAELEARLAESRDEIERYRSKIASLRRRRPGR